MRALVVLALHSATVLATPVDRLHDAVRADDAAAVEAALREPLAKQSLLETRDALGYTPLLRAADQANPKILTLLLEAGADLAAVDNSGSSALHLAAESGSAESLELLLKAGATRRPGVDVKDRFGVTALALAAMRGHADAARVLVAHGASPHAEDEDGKTPLSESQGEAEEITAAASAAAARRHPLGHEGATAAGSRPNPAFRGHARTFSGRPTPTRGGKTFSGRPHPQTHGGRARPRPQDDREL